MAMSDLRVVLNHPPRILGGSYCIYQFGSFVPTKYLKQLICP
jgi:hypothetical protein